MAENPYRCSCGKTFKTAQGLAGHQRFCRKASQPSVAKESVSEWEQRFSKLQQNYQALSVQNAESLKKLNRLEELVNQLVQYVCPDGRNWVGINASRTIELANEVAKAKAEMEASQKKFEKEIKAWVWEVIPERFRPKWP